MMGTNRKGLGNSDIWGQRRRAADPGHLQLLPRAGAGRPRGAQVILPVGAAGAAGTWHLPSQHHNEGDSRLKTRHKAVQEVCKEKAVGTPASEACGQSFCVDR